MPVTGRIVGLAVLSTTTVVSVAGVPPAFSQEPAATPTVTATGSAHVKPTPQDSNSDASIRKAVDVAITKALPLAVADARADAKLLAAAAGGSLGQLLSISDAVAPAYPFYIGPENGTFGNGHFCGKVRNSKIVISPTGARRRVARKGTHKVCRVPGDISSSVALTFTLTPAG